MKKRIVWMLALLFAVTQGTWAQTTVENESELINAIANDATIQLTADI